MPYRLNSDPEGIARTSRRQAIRWLQMNYRNRAEGFAQGCLILLPSLAGLPILLVSINCINNP